MVDCGGVSCVIYVGCFGGIGYFFGGGYVGVWWVVVEMVYVGWWYLVVDFDGGCSGFVVVVLYFVGVGGVGI